MTSYTYVESTTVDSIATIEARSLTSLSAAGCDTAGLSALSAERGLVALAAASEAKAQEIRAIIARSVSIDDIDGPWLDVVCKGRYEEDRIAATKTVGRPTVTASTGGGTQVLVAGQLRADAGGGLFFTNVQGATIAAGASANIDFACDTAGSVGNVANGAIAGFQRAPAGLTIINAPGWRTFTGRDAETNSAYRARSKAKWSSLATGWTRRTFDYLIPTLATSITKWLVRDDNPNGPGTVEIIAASGSSPASSPELAALLAALGAPGVKRLGSGALTAIGATTLTITVTGTLYGDGTNANLLAKAKQALDDLALVFPMGDLTGLALDTSLVAGVIYGGAYPAYGLIGFPGASGLTLTLPAADVALAVGDNISFAHSALVLG